MSGTENAASGNRGDNESKSTASVARRSGGGNAAAGGDNAKNHLCDCCEGKGENGSDGTSSSMIQLQTCGCTICKDCFSKWLSKSVSSLDGTSGGGSSNVGTEQNDMAWKCPSCNLLMAKSFNAQDDDSTSNRKRAAASTNSPAKRRRLPMANKGKGRLSNAGGADSDSEGSDYATPKKSRARVTRSSSSSAKDKKKNGPLKKRTESKSPKERKSQLTISQRIDQLTAFKNKHGHVDVRLCAIDDPEFTRDEKSLAEWVRRIRKLDEATDRNSRRRSTNISAEDRQRLDEVGFIWDLQAHHAEQEQRSAASGGDEGNGDQPEQQKAKRSLVKKSNSNADKNFKRPVHYITKSFEQRCIDYKNYLQKYNVLDVPRRLPPDAGEDFKGLNNWAMHVRNGIKNLTREKRKMLVDVGFNFETKQNRLNRQWRESYDKLKQYKATHGTTQLPWNYQQDKALSEWVHTQRKLKNRGTLLEERQRLLDEIGFHWGVALGPKKDPTRYQRGMRIDQAHLPTNETQGEEVLVAEQAINDHQAQGGHGATNSLFV